MGVHCGYDASLYLYEYMPQRRWRLVFQSEQDDYRDGHYDPQRFLTIDASNPNVAWNAPAPPPLVLTLGYSPWCQSNWQMIYARLWRASASTVEPRPLIDRKDELYMGGDFIAAGRVTAKDALMEYRGRSMDGGVIIRSHVLHYAIGPGDKLERIAPVALSPNDFIEEWLDAPWAQARRWIEAVQVTPTLAKLHAHHEEFGEFDGPPTRCRRDPDLWQVGWADRHFLVRWRAPYRFSLVDVRTKSFPRCDLKAERADAIGTLFPLQGWTP